MKRSSESVGVCSSTWTRSIAGSKEDDNPAGASSSAEQHAGASRWDGPIRPVDPQPAWNRRFTSSWETTRPSSPSLSPSAVFRRTSISYLRSSQLAFSGSCSTSWQTCSLIVTLPSRLPLVVQSACGHEILPSSRTRYSAGISHSAPQGAHQRCSPQSDSRIRVRPSS